MMGEPVGFSKRQVDRAGATVRELLVAPQAEFNERIFEWVEVIEILNWWRRQHSRPLTAGAMGLRSACQTELGVLPLKPGTVSQRLKRLPTVVDKLFREPKMNASRMQDLGGARAVLPDVQTIRRVQRRLVKNHDDRCRRTGRTRGARISDYIEHPKPSGYRGVHVIVDHHGRWIELQLRTPIQHEWAMLVEQLGSEFASDLKSGVGPPDVLAFLRLLSEALQLESEGVAVDSVMHDELTRLRLAVAAERRIGRMSDG